MKTKRVEVLFDPKEYDSLERVARQRGRPVGSMIREAVAAYVAGPSQAERSRAIDKMASLAGPVASPEEIKRTIVGSQYAGIVDSLEAH